MDDINKMKVTELKQALKDRGLPSSGTKPELVKRLGEALGTQADADSDAALEDDSLQGIDEILAEDTAPPFPPKTSVTTPVTSPAEDSAKAKDAASKPDLPDSNGVQAKSTVAEPVDESGDKIAKPVEVAKLSDAERLKMRADKFGVVSAEAKKELRAQRFGITSPGSDKSSVVLGSSPPNVDMDKLKKRAERFGTVVATSLTKVEEDERKRKRAERFGGSTTVSTNVSSLSSDEIEAKKKKRAERFGITT